MEERAHLLHVLPDIPLALGAAQQKCRMEGRDERRAAVVEGAAAQPRDRILRLQQRLRGECSQGDDDLWLNAVDLLKEERLAGLDLVGLGIAVLRRPAFDDVRDIDVVAAESDGLDDLGQQLAGTPDKRNALDVFVSSRRLADEHQVGRWIANAKYDLPPAEPVQLASSAIANLGANRLKGFLWRSRHGQEPIVFCRRAWLDVGQTLDGFRGAAGVRRAPPPARVEAETGDAEFLEESEVFREV